MIKSYHQERTPYVKTLLKKKKKSRGTKISWAQMRNRKDLSIVVQNVVKNILFVALLSLFRGYIMVTL